MSIIKNRALRAYFSTRWFGDIDFKMLFILKSAQKLVVLKIFEEGRLMWHLKVLDKFQKMVRPPTSCVEIQCYPAAEFFSFSLTWCRDEIHTHIDTSASVYVSSMQEKKPSLVIL